MNVPSFPLTSSGPDRGVQTQEIPRPSDTNDMMEQTTWGRFGARRGAAKPSTSHPELQQGGNDTTFVLTSGIPAVLVTDERRRTGRRGRSELAAAIRPRKASASHERLVQGR